MLTQEKRNQICFQIAMGIGESLDLRRMLSVSVSRYLKELSCAMGAILLTERDFTHRISFSVAYSIPRNFERSVGFKKLIDELSNSKNIEADIITGTIEEGTFYIMGLSDIGLLVLLRKEGSLEKDLLDSLKPLNKKLGEACRACLQNENFQRSSQRFMEMANMLPAIIIELDGDYRLSYINKSTYEIFKQIDSDYFKPTSVFDFFHDDDRELVQKLLERAKKTGSIQSMDLRMKNSRDEDFPVQILFSPIVHEDTIIGYRGIGIDISEKEEHKRQQEELMEVISERLRELDCLYGVTKILSETNITIENIFTRAVNIILPSFGSSGDANARITYEGKEYTSSGFNMNRLGKQHSSKIICNGVPLGELTICKDSDEIFDKEEKNLIDALGRQFSNIVSSKIAEEERNRLYKDLMDDIDTAQSVQSYLLPSWVRIQDDYIISSVYSPSSKVGGDLFDIISVSETLSVMYVGDISGHGVQAALTMTAVKSIVNMLLSQDSQEVTPSVIMTQLNKILSKKLFHDNYMTMILCVVDLENHTLTSISAGHPGGFILDRKTKNLREFEDIGGIPLGWMSSYEYTEAEEFTTTIGADESVCLFTDGVFDGTASDGSRIEREGVLKIIDEELSCDDSIIFPYELRDKITKKGYDISVDDFTFLVFQEDTAKTREDGRIHFQIQPDFSHTIIVGEACETYVNECIDDPTKGLFTKLIVNEFVNNVIEHGMKGKSDTVINITIEVKDKITLIFRDKAIPWELPPREASFIDFFEEKNEESATRGRGIQMIYSVTEKHTRRRLFDLNETIFTLL